MSDHWLAAVQSLILDAATTDLAGKFNLGRGDLRSLEFGWEVSPKKVPG